jgi:hypothetical protein
LFFHTEVNMKKLAVLAAVAMSTTAFAAAEHYGTIRGSYISATNVYGGDTTMAGGGLAASLPVYAQEDVAAPTTDYGDAAKTQIAFNQSRYGINFDGANIEFDFNGAGNTGGAAVGSIRLRAANLTTKFGSVDVTFGKGMSQMAGADHHTSQLSDPLFRLGNTGFITDFVRFSYNINKSMKVAYESTSSGDNNGTKNSGINHGLRFDWMQV